MVSSLAYLPCVVPYAVKRNHLVGSAFRLEISLDRSTSLLGTFLLFSKLLQEVLLLIVSPLPNLDHRFQLPAAVSLLLF